MLRAITVGIEEGIARITLDDGKVNALSTQRLREISEHLDRAEEAGAVVVIQGRDGILSAGFDLRTFKSGFDETVEMLRTGAELIVRLLEFPRPVLTVCTGHAYPMGAFLMLAADSRIAVEGPWQIGLNETAIGLTLPWFAVELARHPLSPPGFARIQSAAMYEPVDAQRLGFVDRIVAANDLAAAVDAELTRLRHLDAASFAATKARINERAIGAIRRGIEEELLASGEPS